MTGKDSEAADDINFRYHMISGKTKPPFEGKICNVSPMRMISCFQI
jgi:hypothetical protein